MTYPTFKRVSQPGNASPLLVHIHETVIANCNTKVHYRNQKIFELENAWYYLQMFQPSQLYQLSCLHVISKCANYHFIPDKEVNAMVMNSDESM